LLPLAIAPLAGLNLNHKSLNSQLNLEHYMQVSSATQVQSQEHWGQTLELWQDLFADNLSEIRISHIDHGLQALAQNWQEFCQLYTHDTQKLLEQLQEIYTQLNELMSFNRYAELTLTGFSNACKFYDPTLTSALQEFSFAHYCKLDLWQWQETTSSQVQYSQNLKLYLSHVNNTEQQARNYRYALQYWRLQQQAQSCNHTRALLMVAHQEQDLYETYASSILRLYPQASKFNLEILATYTQEVKEKQVTPIFRGLQKVTYELSSQYTPLALQHQEQAITIAKLRPLLHLNLEQIEQTLTLIGTLAVVDPMNTETHYTRVAVRQAFAQQPQLLKQVAQSYQQNFAWGQELQQQNLALLA
ncbi:ATP-binding protein, partial [Psittacicella gerlachiana]